MNRVFNEHGAQVECWFRKAPATFGELVTQQNPDQFWVINSGIPIREFGESMQSVFVHSFFAIWLHEWCVGGVERKIGHADMLVIRGSRRVGAVLIDNARLPVSLDWYSRLVVLGQHLALLPLGRIE